MNVSIHSTPDLANTAAADRLAEWLRLPDTRNVMVAAGNSPIDLYGHIANRRLPLSHLEVFLLDEYVGVPDDEPRCCAGLLRRTVAEAWGIPSARFHTVDPHPDRALASVLAHEKHIDAAGGLHVLVLGLGQNGHLGFNEPGSTPDSTARVLDLEPISIEANRTWFGGDYAPAQGVTIGLRTLLAARHVIVLAFGAHKTRAVQSMLEATPSSDCPASFLQSHPDVHVFLDEAAAAGLRRSTPTHPGPGHQGSQASSPR